MTEAALGGQVDVPTISGEREKVKISEGTQSGKQFRIKGRGMPVLRSREIGDLYIQVEVEIPKNLSKRQRELLDEFRQVSSEANHPEATGFFARVKDLFGTRDA
jgi:molecular chaperone DnaJ